MDADDDDAPAGAVEFTVELGAVTMPGGFDPATVYVTLRQNHVTRIPDGTFQNLVAMTFTSLSCSLRFFLK